MNKKYKKFFSEQYSEPIIPSIVKELSRDSRSIKFTDRNKFFNFLDQQHYFSASESHIWYSRQDREASQRGEAEWFQNNTQISEADNGSYYLKNVGESVAIWDQRNKIGFIIPNI